MRDGQGQQFITESKTQGSVDTMTEKAVTTIEEKIRRDGSL
jgi:hypothetical protein